LQSLQYFKDVALKGYTEGIWNLFCLENTLKEAQPTFRYIDSKRWLGRAVKKNSFDAIYCDCMIDVNSIFEKSTQTLFRLAQQNYPLAKYWLISYLTKNIQFQSSLEVIFGVRKLSSLQIHREITLIVFQISDICDQTIAEKILSIFRSNIQIRS
jgi:hypothetical protein